MFLVMGSYSPSSGKGWDLLSQILQEKRDQRDGFQYVREHFQWLSAWNQQT